MNDLSGVHEKTTITSISTTTSIYLMLGGNHETPWLCPLRASSHQPSLLFPVLGNNHYFHLSIQCWPATTKHRGRVHCGPATTHFHGCFHSWSTTITSMVAPLLASNHQPPCYVNCGPATTNQQMPANRNYFHGCIQCGPATTHHPPP